MGDRQIIKELKDKIDIYLDTQGISGTFTENDYNLMLTLGGEFEDPVESFVEQAFSWASDEEIELTYYQAFTEIAKEKLLETIDDNKVPPQVELKFYKANQGAYSTTEKDKIDKYLIMQGQISDVAFPTALITTLADFEALLVPEVNLIVSLGTSAGAGGGPGGPGRP